MPHYVTAPNKETGMDSEGCFYIFSTVVMEGITSDMTRTQMKEWLEENGYTSWLDPRPWNEQSPERPLPENATASQRAAHESIKENNDRYTYWNGDFWFVTEEDGYFV